MSYLLIGLTGGIGAGKSTVAAMFQALGAEVVDADVVARQVTEPPSETLEQLVAVFGRECIGQDGTLNRAWVAEHVFANDEARKKLEAIMHPAIATFSEAEFVRLGDSGANWIVYEASLLIEAGRHTAMDIVVVVVANDATRLARLVERGMKAESAQRRIAAQLSQEEKRAVADYVIDNSGTLAETEQQVATMWRQITGRFLVARAMTARNTLVTGFPLFTARRMILHLLDEEKRGRIFLFARHRDAGLVDDFLSTLEEDERKRIEPLLGNVSSLDLGLSGREFKNLRASVHCIHHMAGKYYLGTSKTEIEQVNIGGTRGVIELALDAKDLRRLCFWSTAFVSGDRDGVVLEDELFVGQRWHNEYEHSKYAAEKIVRNMWGKIPSTIFRPSIIVGDSKTGEIGRYDGPYHFVSVLMSSPFDLHGSLPGKGVGPLNLVPIDFVVSAAHLIAAMDGSVSKTVHLVDPSPLSAKGVFDLVADRLATSAPKKPLRGRLARAVLATPLLAKTIGPTRSIIGSLNQNVTFNCRHMLDLLRNTKIYCPSFDSYVDNLIRYAKQHQIGSRYDSGELYDQLA